MNQTLYKMKTAPTLSDNFDETSLHQATALIPILV
jgi:hypothetical protein